MSLTLTETLPRLVLPDGKVIMPDEIDRIEIVAGDGNLEINEIEWGSQEDEDGASNYLEASDTRLWGVRKDRCTHLPDKNGTMMYENDLFIRFGEMYKVIWEGNGFWAKPNNPLWSKIDLSLFKKRVEITGLVPYGEES